MGPAFVALNSVLAGITLLVALHNLWVWSRARDDRAPLWLGVLALSLVAVMLSGTIVLTRPPWPLFEVALLLCGVALGTSAVFAARALAALTPGLRVTAVTRVLVAVLVVRTAVWLTTDLMVVHPVVQGRWPSYGVLAPTSLVYGLGLIVVSVQAMRATEEIDRVLRAAAGGTVAIAVLTVLARTGLGFEELVSLAVVPGAGAVLWLGAQQVVQTAQARDLLVVRQSALAEVGRAAVSSADAGVVRQDAERLLRRHLRTPEVAVRLRAHAGPADDPGPEGLAVRGRRHTASALAVGSIDPATREFVESMLQVVAASADRAAADAELAHRGTHDTLTGLPNKVLLVDRLGARLSDPDDEQVVLFMCGLSGLDELISLEGHHAADAVVCRVADALRGLVGRGGTHGRLSTDVFAVIEGAPSGDPSAFLGRRLADLTDALPELAGLPAQVRLAVGAVVAGPASTPADLLRDATAAMRRSAAGSGAAEIFDEHLGTRLRERGATEAALRTAVADDAIEVHYQPIVDPLTRTVLSYEALARWRRDDVVVAPLDWIPVAEDCGLIGAIGLQVLRIACRDQAALGVPVAVNVSPHQLADETFADQVLGSLGGCPPEGLTLEVTESALMSDLARAVRSLERLRARGVRVALDDFGTSYSSLGVLVSLPIDVLKIDRIFVQGLATPTGASVVEAIVTLARTLGKVTVAEGVETEDQLAALRALGADRVQGFLTGRPAPLAAPTQAVAVPAAARPLRAPRVLDRA